MITFCNHDLAYLLATGTAIAHSAGKSAVYKEDLVSAAFMDRRTAIHQLLTAVTPSMDRSAIEISVDCVPVELGWACSLREELEIVRYFVAQEIKDRSISAFEEPGSSRWDLVECLRRSTEARINTLRLVRYAPWFRAAIPAEISDSDLEKSSGQVPVGYLSHSRDFGEHDALHIVYLEFSPRRILGFVGLDV